MAPIYFLFYTVLFLNFLLTSHGKEATVPAVLWASRQYQDRPYLILDQIKSEIFESYAKEVLEEDRKPPLLVVFLEEFLSEDDFEWRDENGYGSYNFLVNLSQNYRVDYFRDVESPSQVIMDVTKNTYEWRNLTPETDWPETIQTNRTAFLVQFDSINESRPEALKRHDEIVEKIHRKLKKSGMEWICLYTGRKAFSHLSSFQQLSPWHVHDEPTENSTKVLSLYRDEHTGLILVVRGLVQLYLPTIKNSITINLDNHFGASEKRMENRNGFIVQYPNYTLTFYTRKIHSDWIIDKIKITNENGDWLNLVAKFRHNLPEDKCTQQQFEFQSVQKPLVKVKISKYKFIRLPFQEEACTTPYNLQVVSSFMFLSIVVVAIFWDSILKNQNFMQKSKILRISTETLKTTSRSN